MKPRFAAEKKPTPVLKKAESEPPVPLTGLSSDLPVFLQSIGCCDENALLSQPIQPKLEISAPHDPDEREADRIAEHVMGGSSTDLPTPGVPDQQTASEAQGIAPVQGGSPLPRGEKAFFEQRLGQDLSNVRVHTDHDAADAARSIHARAFTHGNDIYFAAGRWSPGTGQGRSLIAHELAHVGQQRVSTGTNILQRQVDQPTASVTTSASPAAKIARLLADQDDEGIVALTPEELNASTPEQRAGLVKILADLTWTSEAEERAILRLIRHHGEQAQVIAALDVIGYRQIVIDTVQSDEPTAELQHLLGDLTTPVQNPDDPIGRALGSRQPSDVMLITDFSAASNAQRLGLLQIMLSMWSSNAREEATILEILASSGSQLGSLIESVKRLGLKQALFDHIDQETNQQRLTALLQPLNDPELNADLEVFNRGFWGNAWAGLSGGFVSAFQNFSIANIVMGLLQPIIHPIDTLLHLIDLINQFIEQPSWDTLLTALRDIIGTLAVWSLALGVIFAALAAIALGISILLVETIVGAIIGVALTLKLLAISGFFFGWGVTLGYIFIGLAVLKGVIDLFQAGRATTARELQREQRQIGEDITLLGLIVILHMVTKSLGWVSGRLRASATEPDSATMEELERTGDDAQQRAGDADRAADDINTLEDQARQGASGNPAAEPRVILPSGEPVPPDSYMGGYHGTDIPPEQLRSQGGFEARGEDWNLEAHVKGNPESALRGTTPVVSDPVRGQGAAYWAGEGGWVYQFRDVPTWDTNALLEGRVRTPEGFGRNPAFGEGELSVPGDIPWSKVYRYGQVVADRMGRLFVREWTENPDFRPRSSESGGAPAEPAPP